MSLRRNFLRRNLKLALLAGLAGVTILLALIGFIRNLPAIYPAPRPVDYMAYYVAGSMLRGSSGAGLYDAAAEDRRARELGLPGVGGGYLYLPFFAVLIQPLTLLDFQTSARLWLGINLVALFASAHLLLRIARLNSGILYTCLAFALVLIFPPVVSDLIFGQVNILLLLLLTAALYLLDAAGTTPRELAAGVLIGFAGALKFYPALVLVPVATARRWFALPGVALGIGILLVVGLLGDRGFENTVRYISTGGPQVAISVEPLNQSVVAALRRTFEPHTYRFPVFERENYVEVQSAPPVLAPTLVLPLTIALSLAALIASLVALRRMSARSVPLRLPYALFLMLGLLLVPLVWEYYTVLLLIPFAVWLGFRERLEASLFVIVLVTFLLTVHRYWKVLAVGGVPMWLLSFGLAAIVICWVYTIILAQYPAHRPLSASPSNRENAFD